LNIEIKRLLEARLKAGTSTPQERQRLKFLSYHVMVNKEYP